MKKRNLSIALLLAIFVLALCVAACHPTDGPNKITGTHTVDVYAVNDFHGAVNKMPRIAGYLAARKAEGAIIVNSGDMFQGSMESNSNFGKLLTDCMEAAGFDEMTFGNHEFDWGLDNLRNLSQNSGIPFLGANIYNWSRDAGWGEFADDLADKYIVEDVNGIKVGVIGVIGSDQITSISSQLVQDIGFKDPLPIIKELAAELREEQHCNVVVASVHAGPQDIVGEEENYQKPSTSAGLNECVDAVFCAHTHSEQNYEVEGIPFIQGGRYGEYVSHVRFTLNNGNVVDATSENIPYESLTNVDASVRNEVEHLIDNSNDAIEDERNEVLATINSSLGSRNAVPRLVCHAMAEYADSQGYDIDLAICNNARSALDSGKVTYSELYEAIPFDNVVYIAKVSGKDIIKEMEYDTQSMWRVNGEPIQNRDDVYYTIAVIDYLLFHQNANRNYNYFASAFRSGFDPVPLTKTGVEMYNYRLITKDFLLSKSGTFNVSVYVQNNAHTNTSLLEQKVNLGN